MKLQAAGGTRHRASHSDTTAGDGWAIIKHAIKQHARVQSSCQSKEPKADGTDGSWRKRERVEQERANLEGAGRQVRGVCRFWQGASTGGSAAASIPATGRRRAGGARRPAGKARRRGRGIESGCSRRSEH